MTSTDPAPNPHATAEQVEAALTDTKLAQVLYHDWEAETYDDKWSISYDQRCIDYARGRFDAAVPEGTQRELPYDRALELGCDAEGIPYEDNTFDLVVGHAVLHHIPDVELSLREVVRVLKPGGRFVFAGEPTTVGNRYARTLANLTWRATVGAMKLPGLGSWRRPQEELDENSRAAGLEWIVDLHTFEPADLEAMATAAGAVEVATASEEFTAAMLGWPVRTFESTVPPGKLGWGWAKFAFGGWTTLSWVDGNVWRRVVPKGWFYNVMITGVKPHPGS